MPRLIITAAAGICLDRCRSFLVPKNPDAAKRAASAIGKALAALETSPQIGRPSENHPELRELLIPFGDSGYVALYIHDQATDEVVVLAFRHQSAKRSRQNQKGRFASGPHEIWPLTGRIARKRS